MARWMLSGGIGGSFGNKPCSCASVEWLIAGQQCTFDDACDQCQIQLVVGFMGGHGLRAVVEVAGELQRSVGVMGGQDFMQIGPSEASWTISNTAVLWRVPVLLGR